MDRFVKLKIIEINPILPTLVRVKQRLILVHAWCPFSSLWNLTPRDFHPEEVVTLREHGIQPSWKGTHLENRFDIVIMVLRMVRTVRMVRLVRMVRTARSSEIT